MTELSLVHITCAQYKIDFDGGARARICTAFEPVIEPGDEDLVTSNGTLCAVMNIQLSPSNGETAPSNIQSEAKHSNLSLGQSTFPFNNNSTSASLKTANDRPPQITMPTPSPPEHWFSASSALI
jgi:hypothetical protein